MVATAEKRRRLPPYTPAVLAVTATVIAAEHMASLVRCRALAWIALGPIS